MGFYCDSCEKEHGDKVLKVRLKDLLNSNKEICDRKYYALVGDRNDALNHSMMSVPKLVRLKPKLELGGVRGIVARINFACLAFDSGLYDKIKSGELLNKHKIGRADLDKCFELQDCDEVIHGIINKAKSKYWLSFSLRKILNKCTYNEGIITYIKVKNSINVTAVNAM